MNDSKQLKPGADDLAHTATKAGLSLIPGIGGSAAEIFGAIVTPPLQKRRDRLIEDVVKGLEELREKYSELNWDELLKSDRFITATLHATQTALKNHQKEKLEALKNSILNAAVGISIDEDVQLVFLRYIDELTPWHLRVLAYFENPIEWMGAHNIKMPGLQFGSVKNGLFLAFPELRKNDGLLEQIIADLINRGLLGDFTVTTTMSPNGIFASRTSELGQRFMAFIRAPE